MVPALGMQGGDGVAAGGEDLTYCLQSWHLHAEVSHNAHMSMWQRGSWSG